MHRTPPANKPPSQEENSLPSELDFSYPTGKLAAVTRKANELKPLLQSEFSEIKVTVQELFSDYNKKVSNFTEACENELGKHISEEQKLSLESWRDQHLDMINKFINEVSEWFQQDLKSGDSISIFQNGKEGSKISHKSRGSAISSLRARLAEQRAKRIAEENYIHAQREIEVKKQEIEQQERNLLLQKEKEFEKNLEEALNALENESQTKHSPGNPERINKSTTRNIEHQASKYNSNLEHLEHPSSTQQVDSGNILTSNNLTTFLEQQNKISLNLVRNQERSFLPKNEPESFDGSDITKFKMFMITFDTMISAHCDSFSDKLYYLQKYTSGRAQELVKSCLGLNHEVSYIKAIRLLEDRYDNEFRLADCYLGKLESWPVIRNEDGKALEDFSMFLLGCSNAMNDIASLNQLNSPREMLNIVKKLPYKLRERWRTHARKIVESGKHLHFKDLVKFVQEQAADLNFPIFGNIKEDQFKQSNTKSHNLGSNKRKSLAMSVKGIHNSKNVSMNVKSTNQVCLCCKKDNHTLSECFFFAKKLHEDKLNFLREHKLCFACMKGEHYSKYCNKRLVCSKCKGKHPTSLHKENQNDEKRETENMNERNARDRTNGINDNVNSTNEETRNAENRLSCSTKTKETRAGERRTVCPVLPVKIKIKGKNNFVKTYMALDTFSTDCFMSQELLSLLGGSGKTVNISVKTVDSEITDLKTQVINNLDIYDLDQNEMSTIPVVYAKENWLFDLSDSPSPKDIQDIHYLDDIPFQFLDNTKIGLLVGANMPDIMKPLKIVDGDQQNKPFATLYKHGWCFSGEVGCNDKFRNVKSCCRSKVVNQSDIESKLDIMYSRDFCDINEDEIGPSLEDRKWEEKVRLGIKKNVDGHYEVPLPFRDEDISFPSNKVQVKNRLESVKRRMHRDETFAKEYSEFMNMMLQNGFSEKVPSKELNCRLGRVWYLSHHGVYHKQKGKLRVVFNASLKYQGKSLNDELMQGPDLTNNLLGVLLRFRQDNIAFIADIEKMFYQVRVPITDSNFMRFMWFPEGNINKEPEEYRIRVHVFGAVSSPSCSNFALKQTSKDGSDRFSEQVRKTVERDFYVDDVLKSVSTENEAITLCEDLRKLLHTGGFNLTGFSSNSQRVLDSIPSRDLTSELRNIELCDGDRSYEKALGVKWNIKDDLLSFRVNVPKRPNTKRGLLSTTFSIYDPYGILSPVFIEAKRIFQEACQLKIGWDDPLPERMIDAWNTWLGKVDLLHNFEIPRCLKPQSSIARTELHFFSDGSEIAYAAVGYLRFITSNGIFCNIVIAKSRLTPLNGRTLKTIPRIELNAAKLAVSIGQILNRELELKIDKEYYWTDSTTVLKYINNDTKRFQRFVSNRVSYIRRYTQAIQWHYVPSECNPSDLASRGTNVPQFLLTKEWVLGPKFLCTDESEWPHFNVNVQIEDYDPELKQNVISVATKSSETLGLSKVLDSSSNWYKTKCRIVYLLRLKEGLLRGNWIKSKISVEELKVAEREIWKHLQKENFSSTIELLLCSKPLPAKNALRKLQPFLDEFGIMRVGGRLRRLHCSYDTKHPIILPKKSHIIDVIVRNVHHTVGHLGKSVIVSTLRQRFWIIGINTIAKRIVRECIGCRKRQARPSEQIMADLPEERLLGDEPVFTYIGLDAFGPYYVSRGRGRTTEKRYGIIFTCLASRAIHIEVAYSLETDSFLCALRRFIARRGNVKIIRSDNGTNFTGANRELRESMEVWNRVSEHWMRQRNIEWKFNPPTASHFGGIWEREIRSIRKVLNALLNQQLLKLTDERLNTLMCEVESILNNRPITELSDDPNDLEPLTPNHLLLGESGATFPPGLFSADDLYSKRRWHQVQYLANLFWSRWRKEYLPLLHQKQKWVQNRKPHCVGDLVLVIDQNLPRNQWCTGRITEVKADKWGNVRIAKVLVAKAKNMNSKTNIKIDRTILERPITKLILLKSFDSK